jgi:hypothetical protein
MKSTAGKSQTKRQEFKKEEEEGYFINNGP